jgi:hypothetical protein
MYVSKIEHNHFFQNCQDVVYYLKPLSMSGHTTVSETLVSKQHIGNQVGTYILQMVYFKTKNNILGIFWRALEWKMLVYLMIIWNILRPFCFIYVIAIWYI